MFNLEQLPQEVVVVGAGFIACEFACILRGLGVEVTQVVRGSGLLRGFDRELADAVLEGLQEQGIHVLLERSVTAVSGQPADLTVQLSDGLELPCGGVLMATGRRPWLDGLGLDAAGVAVEDGRIRVMLIHARRSSHLCSR